jgi:bifunctional non-homologous end joining protein LigD
MPGFIKPQLATLKSKAPPGGGWLHEIKYDGYRTQFHIDGDDRKAFTRNGLNWIKRFSTIAGSMDIPGPSTARSSSFTRGAPISPRPAGEAARRT